MGPSARVLVVNDYESNTQFFPNEEMNMESAMTREDLIRDQAHTIRCLRQSLDSRTEEVERLRCENGLVDADEFWERFEEQAKHLNSLRLGLQQTKLEKDTLAERFNDVMERLQNKNDELASYKAALKSRGFQINTLQALLNRERQTQDEDSDDSLRGDQHNSSGAMDRWRKDVAVGIMEELATLTANAKEWENLDQAEEDTATCIRAVQSLLLDADDCDSFTLHSSHPRRENQTPNSGQQRRECRDNADDQPQPHEHDSEIAAGLHPMSDAAIEEREDFAHPLLSSFVHRIVSVKRQSQLARERVNARKRRMFSEHQAEAAASERPSSIANAGNLSHQHKQRSKSVLLGTGATRLRQHDSKREAKTQQTHRRSTSFAARNSNSQMRQPPRKSFFSLDGIPLPSRQQDSARSLLTQPHDEDESIRSDDDDDEAGADEHQAADPPAILSHESSATFSTLGPSSRNRSSRLGTATNAISPHHHRTLDDETIGSDLQRLDKQSSASAAIERSFSTTNVVGMTTLQSRPSSAVVTSLRRAASHAASDDIPDAYRRRTISSNNHRSTITTTALERPSVDEITPASRFRSFRRSESEMLIQNAERKSLELQSKRLQKKKSDERSSSHHWSSWAHPLVNRQNHEHILMRMNEGRTSEKGLSKRACSVDRFTASSSPPRTARDFSPKVRRRRTESKMDLIAALI